MISMHRIIVTLAAALLICGCQKYYLMIPPPTYTDDELDDEDVGTSSRVENIFVSVYGDGDMNGSSWDHAYDVAGLRTILTDKSDLSNTVIYLAEGKYIIGKSEGSGLELKKDIMQIKGGYSAASTGSDLAKRDPGKYETILSGDVNLNGKADAGDCAMFMVTAGTITFDGVVFEGGYIDTIVSAVNSVEGSNGSSSGAASVFGIFGEPASTSVEVVNCVFRGNLSVAAHNGSAEGKTSISGGPCAMVTSGFFKAEGCTFIDNVAVNRGGAIRLMGAEAVCFLDKCLFTGNRLTGSSEGWGSSIQVSYGHLCINNSTFIDNQGKGGEINGGGSFFMSNSTFFQTEADTYGAFRCESIDGADSHIINNVFSSRRDDGTGFNYSGDNRDITSSGFNLFQRVKGKDIRRSDDVLWPSPLGGTLSAGCWQWDASQVGSNADELYAKLSDVLAAVKAFNPTISSDPALVNLGYRFYEWVGENGFAEDQRGRPRNPSKMQKGSYDEYLTGNASTSAIRITGAMVGRRNLGTDSFRIIIRNSANPSYSYATNMIWSAGAWASSEGIKMMWDPGLNPVDILAVAPAMEEIDDIDSIIPFSAATDQTSGIEANDLLVCKTTVNPKVDLKGGGVVLQFNHAMSRLAVKISNLSMDKLTGLTVSGVVVSGKCDFSSASPSVVADGDVPGTIGAYKAESEFQAMIIPQTTPSVLKISFTDTSGITYDWQSDAPVTFESGKTYSLTLTSSDSL